MRNLPNPFSPFPACLYCDAPVESFEPGPKGGASQNMTCRRCGARYNLAIVVGLAVRGTGEVLGPGPLFLEVLQEPNLKTGDAVVIHCVGNQVDGSVILASENGVSLMLQFEAILDGHVGMMPVLRGDDGVYRSVMTGSAVEITISRAADRNRKSD